MTNNGAILLHGWAKTMYVLFLAAGMISCQPQVPSALPSSTPTHAEEKPTASPKTSPTATGTPTPTQTTPPTRTPVPMLTEATWGNFTLPAEVISVENANRLSERASLGLGDFDLFAFSPDGSFLAVASSIGVTVYITHDWKELLFLPTHNKTIFLLFSPNGQHLASGTTDGLVNVWEMPNGKVAKVGYATGHTPMSGMAFSPDGSTLAIASSSENRITFWHSPYEGRGTSLTIEDPYEIGFSSDGTILAVADSDHSISLYNVNARASFLQFPAGKNIVFSPTGGLLAAGNGTIFLWNVADGKEYARIADFPDAKPLEFSADGAILSLLRPGQVILWDVIDRKVHRILSIQATEFTLSPDGIRAAFHNSALLSKDAMIWVWDTAAQRTIATLEGFHSSAMRVGFSPDGQLLYAGFSDGAVRSWNLAGRNEQEILPPDNKSEHVFSFSPDGHWLAVSDLSKVALRALPEGRLRTEIELPGVNQLVFSPSGNLLAGISSQQGITLWSVEDTGRLQHQGYLSLSANNMAFSPDEQWLAVILRDYSLSVRKMADGREAWGIDRSPFGFMDVAILPAGDTMAAGGGGGYLGIWNLATGEIVGQSSGDQGITSITISPDGRIISAGMYQSILLLRSDNGELIAIRGINSTGVPDQRFSPDGRLLAVCEEDGAVRLWGIRDE